MRWLVTGGAGFIGSHVVDALMARGEDAVVALDNLRRGRWEHLSAHDGDPRLARLDADIRDADAVREACAGVDIVVHLAAQSNVLGASKDVHYSSETNVVGTVNVLAGALDAGVRRAVFTSSREVYGDPEELPVREDRPLAPKNFYGASKAAGEAYCGAFRQRGLDVRTLRLANVYGPRDTQRVIPLWLDRAQRGLDLEVYGGKQVLDFIWIDVVVEALLRAADLDSLSEPVNVGSGQGTPIIKLAERILSASGGGSSIRIMPAREEEVVRFVADTQRMRDILGLAPPDDPLAHLPLLAGQQVEAHA
ncbi:MAG: NAD-dependent epimerase/dehydratase family protein [Dehalococcoidia bacterium]